jgi:hypothetical protein
VQRSLRPFLLLVASLAGAHWLVSACSLDLDESLIPGAGGDASFGDAESFGGFEAGGAWSDAKADGAPKDANGDGETGTDATADVTDSGPATEEIECGSLSCDVAAICCWDSDSGMCTGPSVSCSSVAIGCDQTSDCGSGEACCVLDIAGSVGCATTCPDTLIGSVQFCEDDTECTTGACDTPPVLIANMLPSSYKTCQ